MNDINQHLRQFTGVQTLVTLLLMGTESVGKRQCQDPTDDQTYDGTSITVVPQTRLASEPEDGLSNPNRKT